MKTPRNSIIMRLALLSVLIAAVFFVIMRR
jgi:hypothetical protein